jgi:o-succinylbenzoate synthase
MIKASWKKLTLDFKLPSGTSRGILTQKDSWILSIWNITNSDVIGKGEASIIKTLSPDWNVNFEAKVNHICENITEYSTKEGIKKLAKYPSIQLALETALLDLENGAQSIIFPSDFVNKQSPIPINGLIWMGDKAFMKSQIETKIKDGFDCIKLKIGAIDFETELQILKDIRSNYSATDIELRVDANGAFSPENALNKLEQLSKFDLHSIEQPIKAGQLNEMAKLCSNTPLPIALDEELIGVIDFKEKTELLQIIKPQYIILKPSLIGGFNGSDEWINLAKKQNIEWWITSALESNIGLNAIAQYTFTKNNLLPQGLGTGGLFTNNTPSNLVVKNGTLILDSK